MGYAQLDYDNPPPRPPLPPPPRVFLINGIGPVIFPVVFFFGIIARPGTTVVVPRGSLNFRKVEVGILVCRLLAIAVLVVLRGDG